MSRQKLTPQECAEILERRRMGERVCDLAEEYNVGRSAIYSATLALQVGASSPRARCRGCGDSMRHAASAKGRQFCYKPECRAYRVECITYSRQQKASKYARERRHMESTVRHLVKQAVSDNCQCAKFVADLVRLRATHSANYSAPRDLFSAHWVAALRPALADHGVPGRAASAIVDRVAEGARQQTIKAKRDEKNAE